MLLFTFGWGLNYILGGLLILINTEDFLPFMPVESSLLYFFGTQLSGLIFILTYKIFYKRPSFLNKQQAFLEYKKSDLKYLLIFAGIGIVFGVLFILKISIPKYFDPKLALYRADLGDYTFIGIGFYYYLMMLNVPAAILLLDYTVQHPRVLSITASLIYFSFFLLLTVPLGGRGRTLNIFIVVGLSLIFRLWNARRKFIYTTMALSLFFLVFVSLIWGNVRENPIDQIQIFDKNIEYLKSLRWDLTRVEPQTYIIATYPPTGRFFGTTYILSILGPFQKYLLPYWEPSDLISDLSRHWYYDMLGVEIRSAISPSLIGEMYMNFGVCGLCLAGFVFAKLINFVQGRMNLRFPLQLALLAYFFLYLTMHGGFYNIFDILWICWPIWGLHKLFVRKRRESR